MIIIDMSVLLQGNNAKFKDLDSHVAQALSLAGEGNDVLLTGQGPIWLYLKIAHALHGVARKLTYRSPVTGDLVIFDHSPE
ncbi:MAG: CRISPR-associated protein Csx3 [Syntrophorhabdaceae bacterium]|nr:CRISPR-associated protein Csx3 [Syntrophorhabdaceae bacterium]MDD4197223.1 CRISPR-associated protein Csx3 [Syntrophorhabdaceae bacterium]